LEFCRSSFSVNKKNLKNVVNVRLTDDVRLENGARAGPHGHLKQDSHSNQRNSMRATEAVRLSGFSSTNLIVTPNDFLWRF
jgi:hypothetical protein